MSLTPAGGPGWHWAVVGLGGNLGDARATVQAAMRQLQSLATSPAWALPPGLADQAGPPRASSLWRSSPVEAVGPDFINAVWACPVPSQADPLAFLDALQAIEQAHGRERPYVNAPRTLDLDLLLWGAERIAHPRLIVPHPRAHQRAFVLAPLAELWPRAPIPGQAAVHECLAALQAQDGQHVERIDPRIQSV